MKLHEQVKQLGKERTMLNDGLLEIRRYLNSEKFSKDIMVNKNDILMRITEVLNDVETYGSDLAAQLSLFDKPEEPRK